MRVAVVGGGIAGLAAALRLRDRFGPAAEITVYEQRSGLGGKLSTGSVAGVAAEQGADAFLVREPGGTGEESAAVALARQVGLGDQLVHPEPLPAGLALAGRLRPLPGGTLLGVPGDLAAVAEVAQPAAERDRDGGHPLLAPGEDVAVGELVRRRLGGQLVDRLVDPLLGGVYAGRADTLSLATTMPGLAAACRTEPTLVGAVRAALAAAPRPAGTPVFAAVRGGMSRLVAAVAAASGAWLRLGQPVRELTPAGGAPVGATAAGGAPVGATAAGEPAAPGGPPPGAGWWLSVGSTRDPERVAADAVVLALPARPAARLLQGVHPPAARLVGELDYASVALVTVALPGSVELPPWTGFLVPEAEGTVVKAATFLTTKWGHLRRPGGPVLVRASVGRYREARLLRLADPALVQQVRAELGTLLGRDLPEPVAARVQRWGGSLPQYAPGHLDRVAAARAALPATLALAGAGYDGVGIPACVRSGQTAADQLAAALEQSPS